MILSDNEILSTHQAVPLVTPFVEANLQSTSLDLRLGAVVSVRTKSICQFCAEPYQDHTAEQCRPTYTTVVKSWVQHGELLPGAFVVSRTVETVVMPQILVGEIRVRPVWAAQGLDVIAGAVEPGFDGQVLLGLRNIGREPLALGLGLKVCGVSFSQLSSAATRTAGA